jgi:hypothetical protein
MRIWTSTNIVTTIVGLTAGAVGGSLAILARSESDHLWDWLGFYGSILGGALTLAAGIMAWRAAREASDRDDARDRRREDEARSLIIDLLAARFSQYSTAWEYIDATLNPTLEQRTMTPSIATLAVGQLRAVGATVMLDEVEPLVGEISLRDQSHINRLIKAMSRLDSYTEMMFRTQKLDANDQEPEPQPGEFGQLRLMRVRIAQVMEAARPFDVSLASAFDGRVLPTKRERLVWAILDERID